MVGFLLIKVFAFYFHAGDFQFYQSAKLFDRDELFINHDFEGLISGFFKARRNPFDHTFYSLLSPFFNFCDNTFQDPDEPQPQVKILVGLFIDLTINFFKIRRLFYQD